MAELAPRDVVARAIVQEIAASSLKPAVAYLDLRHLDAAHLRARFPRIYATCKVYGIDIATDLIPVRPAAHYLMGGVKTDLKGRSTLRGLYAAGEVACTGVHGANRLASNSLLEGLVFGARVAESMRNERRSFSPRARHTVPGSADRGTFTSDIAQQVQAAMWQYAGVVREKHGLRQLQDQVATWKSSLRAIATRPAIETRNLLSVADLITRSALAREESRGAHFRKDFPQHDDARFLKHSVVIRDQVDFQ